MNKVDLKQEMPRLYRASAKEVEILDVPELSFLMVDGTGDPNGPAFQDAVGALYTLSYTLKFLLKNDPEGADFGVMPLEGLWWTGDPGRFDLGARDSWNWTAMIRQPAFVTEAHFIWARDEARRKRPQAALDIARLETYREGLAVQILHVGPFATEPATIARLHQFLADRSFVPAGRHHEIYLSDPRRAAPEKLRTILRQPVRPA
jgi:hypothetical protein